MLSFVIRRTLGTSLIYPNTLMDNEGARYKYKKLGRGRASGKGKTSTRGHKGQNARTGGGVAPYFEGGQTSITTRIPKWGFNREHFRPNYDVLNFSRLYYFISKGRIDTSRPIKLRDLFEAGVFSSIKTGVKLLAGGIQFIDRPLHLEVTDASKAAVDAIKAKGGSVTLLYKTEKQVEYSVKPYKFDLPMREYAMPPPHEAIKWKKKESLGATLKFLKPSWLDSYKEPDIPKIPQFIRKPKPLVVRKIDYNLKLS